MIADLLTAAAFGFSIGMFIDVLYSAMNDGELLSGIRLWIFERLANEKEQYHRMEFETADDWYWHIQKRVSWSKIVLCPYCATFWAATITAPLVCGTIATIVVFWAMAMFTATKI